MKKDSVIYAIGDSQIRAIAYQKSILPFFIGGSAFNNFLTEKKAEKTAAKIKALLSKSEGDENLLFIMNGDPIHFSVKTLKTNEEKSEEELLMAANRYVSFLKELQSERNGKIAVCSSIIGAIEKSINTFKSYNEVIQKGCNELGILYLDIFSKMVDNDIFNEEYRADWAHINQKISPFVVQSLKMNGFLNDSVKDNDPYEYSYLYDVPTEEGSYKLWGDFPVEKLQLGKKALKYNLKLHSKTSAHQKLIELVSLILPKIEAELKQSPELRITNSREGFLAFLVNQQNVRSILASDSDSHRMNTGEILHQWMGSDKIQFIDPEKMNHLASKLPVIALDFFDFSNMNHSLANVCITVGEETSPILSSFKKHGYKEVRFFKSANLDTAGFEGAGIFVGFKNPTSFGFRLFYFRWNFILFKNKVSDIIKELRRKPQKAIDGYQFYMKNRKMKKFKDSQ